MEVIKGDSVSVSLPESVCDGSDPVRVQVYPAGGTIEGKGVIGNFFSPAFAGKGQHIISYKYIESHQCEVKKYDTIVVSEIPETTLSLSKVSFCEKDLTVNLEGGTPVGGSYRVNGELSDSIRPDELQEGTHEIRYTYSNQYGCSDSTTSEIYVNANPTKPSITKIDGTLRSSATTGNQWYDENGVLTGETNREYQPAKSGNYLVVTMSDSGCTTASDSFFFEFVGLRDVAANNVRIYPNPSSTELFVRGFEGSARYSITEPGGKLVLEGLVDSIIDVTSLPEGFYILYLENDKIRSVKRFEKVNE